MTLAQQLKSMSLPGTPAYRAAEAMEAAEGALSQFDEAGECNALQNGSCRTRSCMIRAGWSMEANDVQEGTCRVKEARAALAKLRGEA